MKYRPSKRAVCSLGTVRELFTDFKRSTCASNSARNIVTRPIKSIFGPNFDPRRGSFGTFQIGKTRFSELLQSDWELLRGCFGLTFGFKRPTVYELRLQVIKKYRASKQSQYGLAVDL